MNPNAEKIRFFALLFAEARKLGANCSGSEASAFCEATWSAFTSSGRGMPHAKSWLTDRLGAAFLSVSGPPKWTEKEGSWVFWNDRPMVFISQTSLPKNATTESSLAYDQVVYLFGIRLPVEGGFTVVYKTVTQLTGF